MLKLDRQERIRQRYRQIKPGYRPALEVYKAIADELVGPQTRLLDTGCGEAGLIRDYPATAERVVGVDRYLRPIRQTIEIEHVAEADLTALPFPDEAFTLVVNSWVLEHLEAPPVVFAEIARVLKPGGHFLFITPNAYNYLIWARRLVPNRVSKPVVNRLYARGDDYIFPTYYRANTRRSIDRQLVAAGLECRRFETISDPSYTAFNEVFFWLSVGIERLTDWVWPGSKVHLVGLYQKRMA
jgi:SAM-dependent methyltransferase